MQSQTLPARATQHEPRAKSEEHDPGDALENGAAALVPRQALRGAARGKRDDQVDNGPLNVEQDTERDDLQCRTSTSRVNELGQKGHEEQRDLRVEYVRDDALTKYNPARCGWWRLDGVLRARAPQRTQPEPDEVEATGELHGQVRR